MSLIENAIQSALDERRIIGAVVLVARKGEPVFSAARGVADREAHQMREDECVPARPR